MNFEQLQKEWRKEMAITPELNDFSLDKLASRAKKVERDSRFAGMVFGSLAVAILLLGAFLLLTNSIPRTPWKLVELVGIPVLYTYAAWLYFRAIRKPGTTDWTLSAKISSEKEKLARQIALARKAPTHIMLPIYLIVLLGIAPDLLDGTSGEPGLAPYIMLAVLAITLVIAAMVMRRNIKHKLQPMLDRFTQLEDQLRQE